MTAKAQLMGDLLALQHVLEEMGPDFSGLARQGGHLRSRLGEGRFRLAVLGQFKRGKSTLLNALLGEPLLPTGVLPLTAIPTILRYGPERRVRVTRLDGRCEDHAGSIDILAQMLTRSVTEQENPANRLGIAHVEVEHPAALLAQGVEIIDTPGIGSTILNNTRTARETLPVCDGALFVLSPDPPITETEVEFLRAVKDALGPVTVVLTKSDLLPASERQHMLDFLRNVLEAQAGATIEEPIFVVSARQGLHARTAGEPSLWSESGLAALETFLSDFLVSAKQDALEEAIRTKAARLIGETLFTLDLQRKVIELPRLDLEGRFERFEAHLAKIERERVYLSDRLAGDRQRMLEDLDRLAEAIAESATKALTSCIEKVREEAGPDLALGHLEHRLQTALSEEAHQVFRRAMNDVQVFVTKKFRSLQDAHCRDMEHLIDRVRQTAADLFEVPCLEGVTLDRLEGLKAPPVVGHRWVTSFTEEAVSWLDRFLPRKLRARRSAGRFQETIHYLVARNVEEIRWAVRQTLEDTVRSFQARMEAQLEATLSAIRTAVRSATEHQAAREARSAPASKKREAFRERLQQLHEELTPSGKNTPLSHGPL